MKKLYIKKKKIEREEKKKKEAESLPINDGCVHLGENEGCL